ncbi:hypothetical protein Ahy_B06g082035 [Arachis hypogaea]|uniref:Aminotransferase-like plant mobile domain-containing protein n=1 Tax=Arachis hypogaea TaxID=3818 RepID=A0A444YMN4_ARAHY|nr:hypothetical protein Ahy_B06g082035 [Arachis hypogaea]
MVKDALRATEFYQVSKIGLIRGYYPLLSAIRPKTHTLVLSMGEIIVPLEDVAHIFGLPINEKVVSGWINSNHEFLQSQSIAIFGSEPVMSSIRDVESLDILKFIQGYVRCQIFCLLGSTLCADKSTTYAHANYLPLLRNFQRIHTYS